MAKAACGEFLLRIEDTDQARCRPEFEDLIYEDLAWLGIPWPQPVWRQSQRLDAYDQVLDQLIDQGLVYPCQCTRSDIRQALSAPQETGGIVQQPVPSPYPGTCRHRPMAEAGPKATLRLNMQAAIDRVPGLLSAEFQEDGPKHRGVYGLTAERLVSEIGDIVLARRDTGVAAYHLSVVVDDAAQDITHVIRGRDLFSSTFIHVALQTILGLPVPRYHHHRLIRDENGQRLAKRDDARALSAYRAEGYSPDDICTLVGLDRN